MSADNNGDVRMATMERERDRLPQLSGDERNAEPNYGRSRDAAHGEEDTE